MKKLIIAYDNKYRIVLGMPKFCSAKVEFTVITP